MHLTGGMYALLERAARADPSACALWRPGGRRWTYGRLFATAARFAAALAAFGAAPGERVAVQVDKGPAAVALYLACLRGGYVYLPLAAGWTDAELVPVLADADPAVIVCAPAARRRFTALARGTRRRAALATLDPAGGGSLANADAPTRAPVERGSGDLAALLYTSGTTGRPKGVLLTHGNLAANALALRGIWGFGAGDVLLHVLPLNHVHGLFVACHTALLAGASMILVPRFDPEHCVRLLRHATVLMGVPTHYSRLLGTPALDHRACRHMRLFVSGSAPLPERLFHAFAERTGHAILERYGMTETGIIASNPLCGPRLAGSVGFPLPETELRIAADDDRALPPQRIGEVQVRGPGVSPGYWRMPERRATDVTADGFLRTGDLGRLDAGGRLWLVGRSRELIISGGLNVYPREVEAVLEDIDGVREAAVFGVVDADLGEVVTAAVVPSDPHRPPSAERVRAAARARLAGYKVPRRVLFVDALPRNAMGKVQKHTLQARFGAAPGRAPEPL